MDLEEVGNLLFGKNCRSRKTHLVLLFRKHQIRKYFLVRSQNIIMLGICGVVMSAIVYFVVAGRSPREVLERVSASLSPVGRSPAATAEPVLDASKQETLVRPQLVRGMNRKHTKEPEVLPVIEAPKQLAVTTPPLGPQPTLADIRPGMDRKELLNRFPDPTMLTSTLKDGDTIELLSYQQLGTNTATFAQLQNGVVQRVYSGIAPRRLTK